MKMLLLLTGFLAPFLGFSQSLSNQEQNKISGHQTITVSGWAKIAGKQFIKGIRVAVKGTPNATYTDSVGHYTIKNVPLKSVLLFSHADAKNSEVPVNGNKSIIVGLTPK